MEEFLKEGRPELRLLRVAKRQASSLGARKEKGHRRPGAQCRQRPGGKK